MAGKLNVAKVEKIPGQMNAAELAKLERIARNMPFVGRISLANAADDDLGMIYMAWGKDAKGTYLGLWGARGFGRALEFKPAVQTEGEVRNTLMADATQMLEGMDGAHMLDAGWWRAGRA